MSNTYFKYATPESVGISSDAVQKLIDTMCMHPFGEETHGFTIIRHKKIIAEGTFRPYKNERHSVHSCSKAFTATAIGFAQKEGLLSINDPILKYLSDFAPAEHDERLDRMTIRHLLIMANGHSEKFFKAPFKCGDEQTDILTSICTSKELIDKYMNAAFGCEPGTKFSYNNVNSYLLSHIIRRVTGMDTIDYLRPRLLDKLGIDPLYSTDPDGIFLGYGTLQMTMEELARFGQFYMDGCVWEGERLLGEEWAKEATAKQISNGKDTSTPGLDKEETEKPTDWNQGYAYHMWRGQHNSFRFCGANGQICACYPQYDLMFCLNSGHTDVVQDEMDSFYENILTKLTDVLPENEAALSALRKRCENLALPVHFSDVSPMAERVSGREYEVDCGHLCAVRLDFKDKVCGVTMRFRNGISFEFDAGLSDYAYTDFSYVPLNKEGVVRAATGCWNRLNEFEIVVRRMATQYMMKLTLTFTDGDCKAELKQFRTNYFGLI